MFKKYLIVASKKNPAATNIVTSLSQFKPNQILPSMSDKPFFDIYMTEEEVLYNENLDMERINKYDFVIFPCTHKSERSVKSLSVHTPGNWRGADFGGEEGKICPSSALFTKQLFEFLHHNVVQYDLKDYEVTMEVTHHGPLINRPCVFIEIGSTEKEWADRRAGFVIAKTISDTIENFEKNPYREVAIGIGGPHYCPNFNKLQFSSNVAFSHIIPGYASPLSDEMIKEAVKKTYEEIDFAVIDWKGIPGEDERKRIIEILDKNYLSWKKTSDVDK